MTIIQMTILKQKMKNMKNQPEAVDAGFFEKFAIKASKLMGGTSAFIIAFILVLGWAATGPIFHYSDSWQMVINTGTTIITFLMVFLIQKAQNKDSLAIQLKLNELVAAHEFASNRLVNVENMSEEEMMVIQKFYLRLSQTSKEEESLRQSRSIDEAAEMSTIKKGREEEIKNNLKAKKK